MAFVVAMVIGGLNGFLAALGFLHMTNSLIAELVLGAIWSLITGILIGVGVLRIWSWR